MSKSAIAKLEIYDRDAPLPLPPGSEPDTAIRDLLDHGRFHPVNDRTGPYDVRLSIEDGRLVIRLKNGRDSELPSLVLAMTPYRQIIRDYFMMIESYEQARHSVTREKLEAIDMGRRSLHNEGADLLMERLKDKIEMDHETARRFFTLICALHQKTLR